MSAAHRQSLVSLSFRHVKYSSKARTYVNNGKKPLLELEVIGESTTLKEVAEQLFFYYLENELDGETLNSHLWRFEPTYLKEARGERVELDTDIPMLSKSMTAHESSYCQLGFVDPINCAITVGFEMLFCYDEGSPTMLAVLVDSIEPLPPSLSVEDFPRRTESVAHPAGPKRSVKRMECGAATAGSCPSEEKHVGADEISSADKGAMATSPEA